MYHNSTEMEEKFNYDRIEKAIKYVSAHIKQQPSLEEIAAQLNMSEFHFQRIFTEWAGISPKKFLQYLTIEELKKELKNFSNLIEAAEQVGLSAQSRVYDLFVTIEAVTPQEYKQQGKGLKIEYGFHSSPFGECFIAVTTRGICALSFINNNREAVVKELQLHWENASLQHNQVGTKPLMGQIFEPTTFPSVENSLVNKRTKVSLKLFLKGSRFQLKVWEALLKVPFGTVTSYQQLAKAVDSNAVRAVGSAIANNPIGYLIPCHRVIRSEGIIGQYHWKPERKAAIIAWEKSKFNALNP